MSIDTSFVRVPAAMPDGGPATRGRLTCETLLATRSATAHVIGAVSAEGVAVMRLLQRMDFSDIVVHDTRPRTKLRAAFRTTHGAYSRAEQDALWDSLQPTLDNGCFDDDYLSGVTASAGGVIVLGQGWYLDPDNRARIIAAIPPGAIVTSMSELYLMLAPGPVAGITGTNGKSTTVALVEHLLCAGDVAHRSAGNERSSRQFLPEILEVPPGTWTLLEISNRQLMQVDSSPDVAAITALTPDHLDEHGGYDGYVAAKRVLFSHQSHDAVAIANADDPGCLDVAAASPAQIVRCGIGPHPAPSVSWHGDQLIARDVPRIAGGSLAGEHVLANRDDLQLPGDHNLRNATVAVATALAMGVEPSRVARALASFAGKALRLERVATIDGVEVFSDIKSTTPEATIAALQALAPRPLVLIAGGEDKGLDYAPLADVVLATGARVLLVPGSATDKLQAQLGARGVVGECCGDLALALDRALQWASPGWGVIVSPAAAGFWTTQLQGKPSLRALVRARSGHGAQQRPSARSEETH